MSEKPAPASASLFTRRTPRAILIGGLTVVALTALDLGSKSWAEETLSRPRRGDSPSLCEPGPDGWSDYQRLRGESIPLVEGILEFEYAENCGAAFSLLHDAPHRVRSIIFSLAALIAIIVLTVMFVQGRGGTWLAAGVPLVVSGALGNLVDRLRYGYVVDFIHFQWPGLFDYPVFNVADIGVVVGVILLVIDGWRTPEPTAAVAVVSSGAAAPAEEPKDEAEDEDEDEPEPEPRSKPKNAEPPAKDAKAPPPDPEAVET